MKYEAVIFDMDGVIIDSEPLHFKSDMLTMRECGVELTFQEMQKFIGVSDRETYEVLKKKYNITDSVEDLLNRQIAIKERLFGSEEIIVMDGLEQLLDLLDERGFKIGLASSSKKAFIEIILKRIGLKDRFSVVVSGEDVKKGKPEPDIFLKAAKGLGISAQKCIAIEDSASGVRSAKSAGMYVFGFVSPHSFGQDISPSDTKINSLMEATDSSSVIFMD
ncbi:HAD family phosphatase [Alkalibacter sp. M17DMB]|nr:HAD family phosphatase [Alkalibacter mobilis]